MKSQILRFKKQLALLSVELKKWLFKIANKKVFCKRIFKNWGVK